MTYIAIGVCRCKDGQFREYDSVKYREISYDCTWCQAFYRVSSTKIVKLDPKLVLVFKAIAPWIEVT